ncbi:AAA family ATPase [Candidatus Woesearchaeota archaeon]|nr:AAA family ATPase [Candidatus Woesearchaeota archaeon]
MTIVALVGMPGSGKSEVAAFLKMRGYALIRFGDVTDAALKERNLPQTPQNEQYVREELRKKQGMDAYAKLNLPIITKKAGNVVLDGMRSWEEYLFLKRHFGKRLVVVAIIAPPSVRYERLLQRRVRPLTLQEAVARDHAEIENLHIAGPIVMADYTLSNQKTLASFKEETEKIKKKIEQSSSFIPDTD